MAAQAPNDRILYCEGKTPAPPTGRRLNKEKCVCRFWKSAAWSSTTAAARWSDGVDFDVNAGEVVGLLGPNGAGKTTSFRMTTGQITPNDGQVSSTARTSPRLPMYQRARLGMGYLSQETSVFRKLTVEQNILAILEVMPGLPQPRPAS